MKRTGQRATDDAIGSAVSKATGGRIDGRRRSGGRYGMDPLRRHRQGKEDARKTAAEAASPRRPSTEAGGTGAAEAVDTTPRKASRSQDKQASDQAALDAAGITEKSTRKEKTEALRAHRKDQVSEARNLSRGQWAERNRNSVRSAVDKRRTDEAGVMSADGSKHSRTVGLRPRHVSGGFKDVAARRLKDAKDSFKAAPVASIGRGTKKAATTSAKVAGAGFAAAALGPALPFAAAGLGGLAVANKVRKTQTYDRLTGDRTALAALRARQRTQGHGTVPQPGPTQDPGNDKQPYPEPSPRPQRGPSGGSK